MRSLDKTEQKIMDKALRKSARIVDNKLIDFAQNLANNQQPLGEQFEKVLYENIWNLYVRS